MCAPFLGFALSPLKSRPAAAVCFSTAFLCPGRLNPGAFPLCRSRSPARPIVSIAANNEDGESSEGDGELVSPNSQGQSADNARASRVNDLRERLDRIDLSDDDANKQSDRAQRYLKRETQLLWLATKLFGEIVSDCSEYLEKPIRQVVAGGLAILFGFFSATSASTIIGSVADWDPLAAAVLLVWTEAFTRWYYREKEKSLLLRLINAFKIGLIYGMAVDAFKLST